MFKCNKLSQTQCVPDCWMIKYINVLEDINYYLTILSIAVALGMVHR